MDIGKEITNHLEWIETIASLIGSEEIKEDDIRAVTQHDKCLLGQWLESDASQEFKNFTEFEDLIESHDEFHKLAGKLISAFQLGNEAEAIESEKQFIEMSEKVIGYLHALEEHASEGHDKNDAVT